MSPKIIISCQTRINPNYLQNSNLSSASEYDIYQNIFTLTNEKKTRVRSVAGNVRSGII